MTVVQLLDVKKSYNSGPLILNGVSASIRQGERVALIGANGCGKTTLLKALVGLHAISAGCIETLGETFSNKPSAPQLRRLRRSTGFVFQRHCLAKRRSVLSNVVHGMLGAPGSWRAFWHATAPEPWRANAMSCLDDVRLSDRAMDRADALSGGQQQRVAIARALVRQPRLLIADEPTASLDPKAGREVMALFSDLCARNGITLVFTTHDMDHALAFSDRVIALKSGRVFLDTPSHSTSRAHLADVFAA